MGFRDFWDFNTVLDFEHLCAGNHGCPKSQKSLNPINHGSDSPHVHRQIRHSRSSDGEFIAALVFEIAGMAASPDEVYVVLLEFGEQTLPEVYIQDWFLIRFAPAHALPFREPSFRDCFYDILRITIQRHVAWALECFERGNHAKQFHTIVRSITESLREFEAAARTVEQHHAISPRPRIAGAGAVGVYCYMKAAFLQL